MRHKQTQVAFQVLWCRKVHAQPCTLTVFPVRFYGSFALLACPLGAGAASLGRRPRGFVTRLEPPGQLLTLVAASDPNHFALNLLPALVTYSIGPSHLLPRRCILEMTLNG